MKRAKRFTPILILIILSAKVSEASGQADVWVTRLGGDTHDVAYAVQQTSDGGYIVAGYNSNSDLWVVKLESDGEVTWQKAYEGIGVGHAYDVQETSDGGYIVAGKIDEYTSTEEDAWILKLNANGEIAWQKAYDGAYTSQLSSRQDYARSIQQTSDGGYIVAGRTEYRVWVLKLEADGDITWQKAYEVFGRVQNAYSVQQTSDGGYIVAGDIDTETGAAHDALLLKLDADGEISWRKIYGGSAVDVAYSVQQTSDGGYIVAGGTDSFGSGKRDAWVLKLDADGEVTWQKAYGGSGDDAATSARQTSDGGYIVGGGLDGDVWVLKLDTDGDVMWQKAYGGDRVDEAKSVQQTEDGGYIVAAYAELVTAYPDVWVLKLDAEGELWPDNPYERDALFEVEDTSADENIAELELFDITISVRTTGAAATATQAVAVTDRPTAAPTSPELESPPDEAEDQPTSLTLEWSPSSDPDGGSVKYRVYLDTSSPPEEIAEGGQDISDNQLSVSGLLPRTTYYWMVVAVDDEGETAESETWSFTTERPSEGYLLLSQGVKYTVNQASGQATADEFLVLLTEGGDKVALEAPDGAEIVIGDGEGNDAYQVKSLGELELEYSDGPGNDAFKFLDGDDDDTVTIDDAAGEGDDSYILTFAETGSDSLTIADGDGNDRYHVGFSGATGPSFTLEIEDGPGNDRYAVRGGGAVLGGLSATFTGGEGNDRLTILNIRSTGEVGIEIQDGEGDDAYWIRNVAPLNAEGSTAAIADGEGDDVYIYRQVRGESDDDVTVADGEGKNRYTLGTGKGDDSVTVEDGEGASVYIINLGDGDDSIEVTDSDSRDVYRVNGGKGEDELALTDDFPDDGDVGKIRNVEGM